MLIFFIKKLFQWNELQYSYLIAEYKHHSIAQPRGSYCQLQTGDMQDHQK